MTCPLAEVRPLILGQQTPFTKRPWLEGHHFTGYRITPVKSGFYTALSDFGQRAVKFLQT